jgi:hypothetical protein
MPRKMQLSRRYRIDPDDNILARLSLSSVFLQHLNDIRSNALVVELMQRLPEQRTIRQD